MNIFLSIFCVFLSQFAIVAKAQAEASTIENQSLLSENNRSLQLELQNPQFSHFTPHSQQWLRKPNSIFKRDKKIAY